MVHLSTDRSPAVSWFIHLLVVMETQGRLTMDDRERNWHHLGEVAASLGKSLSDTADLIAIHEAGHAMMRMLHGCEIVSVSLGATVVPGPYNSVEIEKDVDVAGTAAELLIFGEASNGNFMDIVQFEYGPEVSQLIVALFPVSRSSLDEGKFFEHAFEIRDKLQPFREKLVELAELIKTVGYLHREMLTNFQTALNDWRLERGV